MRNLIILMALVCGLVFVPNSAFAQNLEYADIYITPETNPDFFSGYIGGNIDGGWDWSIGNGVPYDVITEDLIFSTNVGHWSIPDDWIERMRITKDGNVGIGSTSWEPKSSLSKLNVFATDDTPTIYAEQFGTAPGLIVSKIGSGDAMRIGKEGNPGFGLHIVQRGDNSALVISSDITPESRVFAIRHDGSVGIGLGSATPVEKLQVNGNIQASGYKSSDGYAGLTQIISLKGSDGNNCTLTVKNGLITGTTCP
jgi:hypothetical protein